MYIRRVDKQNKKTSKWYSTFKVVECIQSKKGPRQRVLLNLGSHFSVLKSEWKELCRLIESCLSKQHSFLSSSDELQIRAEDIAHKMLQKASNEESRAKQEVTPEEAVQHSKESLVSIKPDSMEILDSKTLGCESIGLSMLEAFGLDKKLQQEGFSKRDQALIIGNIIGRLVKPGSDRSTLEWLQRRSACGELLDFNYLDTSLNRFYESTDKLLEKKNEIERFLYSQAKKQFKLDDSIVLYDLTNSFFESGAKHNKRAKRGRSKEKRSDAPLVSIGLVLTADGFCKRSEFFDGNVSEPSTLESVLDKLSSPQKQIEKPTVILDAGIATKKNLEWLNEHGYKYIVVSRQPSDMPEEGESVSLRKESDQLDKSKPAVWGKLVKDIQSKEARLYCYSEGRAAKEQSIKTLFQERFETDLQKLADGLNKKRTIKQYEKVLARIGRLQEKYKRISHLYEVKVQTDDQKDKATSISWTLNKEKDASKLTGVYCLRSNRLDITAPKLWQTYTLLTEVEAAFRCLKTELAIRPIYHQKTERCDGHMFIALIAYQMANAIRYKLKQHGITWSWSKIRQVMSSQIRATVSFEQGNGDRLFIRKTSKPKSDVASIYEALGYKKQRGKTVQYHKCSDRMGTG